MNSFVRMGAGAASGPTAAGGSRLRTAPSKSSQDYHHIFILFTTHFCFL